MPVFHWQDLQELGTDVFTRVGAAPADAAWVSELLVRASLAGHDSHGVRRIPQYYRDCVAGRTRPDARPTVEAAGPTTVVLDGRSAFGQVAARMGMELAVERARLQGLGAVAIRKVSHIGRLADYVAIAAEAGMAGFLVANDSGANQLVAPPGAVEGRFSTNPLAVGLPRGEPPHLIVDMATTVAAAGKIDVWRAAGRPLPPGWAQDASGNPTTDPGVLSATLPGTLLLAGGYKGFALALVIEVLAGILSGAGASGPDSGPDQQGVLIWVLDIRRFVPLETFTAEVDRLIDYVKSARRREGAPELLVPGERGWRTEAARRVEGIPVDEATWQKTLEVCRELSIDPPEPRRPAR